MTEFYAVCIIAPAHLIGPARQGAYDFHKQDSPHFDDEPEKLLTIGLSPTGEQPATHFLCTCHDTAAHFERIEQYQRRLVAAGRLRVPVTLYVSEKLMQSGDHHRAELAAHEAAVLASLNLRRVAANA